MSATIADCGCECAPNQDPCEPCSRGQFQIQCRSRAGSATLCGFVEWIPSTPPRYYLRAIYGGSAFVERYSGSGYSCAGGPTHDTVQMNGSGAKVWDAGTCTLTSNAQLAYTLAFESFPFPNESDTCGVSAGETLGWGETACSSFLHLWGPANTRTQSVSYGWMSSITTNAACGCVDGSGNATIADCGSGLTITLANEDTEQTAMNRSSVEWSAWSNLPVSCCTTTEGGRTGRNFTFSQAEYRIRVAGTPGSLINVEIFFSRSAGGSFSIIRQFQPTQANFPSTPEEGWVSFQVETGSGVATCLTGAALSV